MFLNECVISLVIFRESDTARNEMLNNVPLSSFNPELELVYVCPGRFAGMCVTAEGDDVGAT